MVEKQKQTDKEEWQLICESWPGLFFILNTHLEVIGVGKDLLDLISQSKEDVINNKINEIYAFLNKKADADDLKWRLSLEYLIHTQQSHQLNARKVIYHNAAGKKITTYWLPEHTPVFNEDNELLYIIHRIQEISHEEVNKGSYLTNKYGVIGFLTTDGIYEIDFKSEKVYWNDQLYAILGYESNEIELDLAKMLRSIHHHDRRRVHDLIRTPQKNSAEFQIEFRLKSKSGDYVDVLSKGIIIRDKKGKPQKLTAAIHDISDYKAQERLKAQMELITHTVPAMICYIGRDLKYHFINPAYKNAFGDDMEGIRGQSIKKVLPEDIYQKVLPHALKALRGERVETEVQYELKNKQTKFCKSWFVPDIDAKGNIRGFINLSMDITKDKFKEMSLNNATSEKQRLLDELSLAHEQISREKNILKNFFMDAPAYISIHEGPQHVVRYLNKRAIGLFVGQSLIGKPFKDVASAVAYSKLKEIFDRVYHQQKEFHAEEFSITTDFFIRGAGVEGNFEERFYNLVVQPKSGFSGNLRGIIVYCSDITDQVRARRALEESAERDRSLLEAMPIITFTLDKRGYFEYFNSKWYQTTGLSQSESISTGFEKVLHSHEAQRYNDLWYNSFQNGLVFDDYVRMRGWDKVYRWYHTRIVPIRNEDGQIIRWIGTSTDIDEQVKANQKKDEFIGIASHELKTPLTSVKAYIQLLQEMFEETKKMPISGYLKKAYNNADKLQDLIAELLDVSRIQSGKMELDIKTFKVDDMVQEVIESAQHSTNTHKIYLDGELDIFIKGDKKRLEQIINNLLSNAIKYSPGKDKVVVKIGHTDTELRVQVTDYGVGIADKDKSKLFEQFYRADDIVKSVSGLGIGLYISQEMARLHGGRIDIESKRGKGSTFTLILPLNR